MGSVPCGSEVPEFSLDLMSKADLAELPVGPGQVIAGRYAVTGLLGKGGMGVVLSGKHLELGERVAIKFLHREHAGHADRFFREARAAARIRSEHVVRIFDVGRLQSGEPYIVMEYLKGEDLALRLIRKKKLSPQEVADTLLDACQALAEAHAAGIVHRDLKPANIFLARGPGGVDVVKLLDFGVAKVPEGGTITKTASVLGSPVYMSPEQMMGSKDVDARSDIWSLGIVLYELLTGDLPFIGDSLIHLGIMVREKPTPKARDAVPELPEAIDAVIAKCLGKERNERFADVGEFAEALLPFASPSAVHSTPRIRRVLDEAKRQGSTELASTIPPPSGEEEEYEKEIAKSLDSLATSKPTVKVSSTPQLALAESIAGVSSHVSPGSSVPTTQPSPIADGVPRKISPLRIAVVAVAAIAVIGIGVSLGSRGAANTTPSTPVSAVQTPAPPTPSSVATIPDPPPTLATASPTSAPATNSASAAPSATLARPAVKRDPRPSSTPSAAVSAAVVAPTTKPTANCNPPFTIDDHGVRHPKPECL
jgi:eukaryotic-like serine/threonine-protein kinase